MRFDVSIVTLPFRQRITDRPLQELGIDPSDVYLSPSVWPQLRWIPRSVMPREIADSDYTRYTTGGTRRLGYESIIDRKSVV